MSRQPLRVYVVALVGLIGFSVLMAVRTDAHGLVTRMLIAALAGLIGSSALFYVQRSMKPR